MNAKNSYVYETQGYRYYCIPEYVVTKTSLTVTGVGLYSQDNTYMGWWPAFNIPLDTLASMRSWVKEHYSLQIHEERKRLRELNAPKF